MKIGFDFIFNACLLVAVAGCDASDDADTNSPASSMPAQVADADDAGDMSGADGAASPMAAVKTVLDLQDLKSHPDSYEWFDFRPNVKKLILSGAAETQHVAILWYTTKDGGVGLHYHSKTESVYVVDGTQTDAKGVYPTGTIYFNPPGSGHAIMQSSGFFILAYASPPDFMNTALIGEYIPARIDTTTFELTTRYSFELKEDGVRVYAVPLDSMGGMQAELTEISSGRYTFQGNYLLVLDGHCVIDAVTQGASKLVVAKTIEPQAFQVSVPEGATCLTLGVSF